MLNIEEKAVSNSDLLSPLDGVKLFVCCTVFT